MKQWYALYVFLCSYSIEMYPVYTGPQFSVSLYKNNNNLFQKVDFQWICITGAFTIALITVTETFVVTLGWGHVAPRV